MELVRTESDGDADNPTLEVAELSRCILADEIES
jgi:hypothetical protein